MWIRDRKRKRLSIITFDSLVETRLKDERDIVMRKHYITFNLPVKTGREAGQARAIVVLGLDTETVVSVREQTSDVITGARHPASYGTPGVVTGFLQ